MDPEVRLIAFYLPQYHPIPENDVWWGKGFTEWTNVAKAKSLFRGHYQPNLPADLGFYDLRVPEVRDAQAELAAEHGIEGFCYWHYWFAGKRLLERPFQEVLKSGKPDLPFCLAWANQTWTGVWHGATDRILIAQTYPGVKDYESHFYAISDALGDSRYITIEGKPVFIVYCPRELPEPKRFTDCWRDLAAKYGLKGLYFIGMSGSEWNPLSHGFDACLQNNFNINYSRMKQSSHSYSRLIYRNISSKYLKQLYRKVRSISLKPTVYPYREFIKYQLPPLETDYDQYQSVCPNWDNTPRSGVRGMVLYNSTPELFRMHLKEAVGRVCHRSPDKKLIFVKSWNEWAEGNYLEPDQRFGKGYLEVIKEELLCRNYTHSR